MNRRDAVLALSAFGAAPFAALNPGKARAQATQREGGEWLHRPANGSYRAN